TTSAAENEKAVLGCRTTQETSIDARKTSKPQIVGLTAMLTYAVGPEKIRKAQEHICHELEICVLPHVSKEELQRDGFHAGANVLTEVRDEVEIPDVFEAHKVVPQTERKPHLQHGTFWKRIGSSAQRAGEGGEGATSFAREMVQIVRDLERHASSVRRDFVSPLSKAKLSSWGEYANLLAKQNVKRAGGATEERFGTSSTSARIICMIFTYLEHWYEALKIVVCGWEEPKSLELAVLFLKMMAEQSTNLEVMAEFAKQRLGDQIL
ncbi:unnamed protein product, partial [Amoebophrya sp. A25]